MALTPEEIADKEFLIGLRGYDKDEVRAYLRTVADAYAAEASKPAPAAAPEPAPEPEAPAAAPAPAASGTDWASLGDEIAAVLRTAHEQAAALKADAEAEAARVRQESSEAAMATRGTADAYAEESRAAAEEERAGAASKLTEAQDEALRLVANAQAQADQMLAVTKERAKHEADASVAHLHAQAAEMSTTRDTAKSALAELRSEIDKALAMAEAPVPTDDPAPNGENVNTL